MLEDRVASHARSSGFALSAGTFSWARVAATRVVAEGTSSAHSRRTVSCSSARRALLSLRVLACFLLASLTGPRHGFSPIRNGHAGHCTAVHSLTSLAERPEQSMQRNRSALSGLMRRWPSAERSSPVMRRGSRPISWPLCSSRSDEHEAIVNRALWDKVHSILQESPRQRAANTRSQMPALLRGLIFGPTGKAITPTVTKKGSRLYRYYVSTDVIRGRVPNGVQPYNACPRAWSKPP